MKKGNTIKMANNNNQQQNTTGATKPRTYEEALKHIQSIQKRFTTEFKTAILDMATALKAAGNDKKAAIKRLENDLRGIVSGAYIFKLVGETYETAEEKKAKTEKQLQAEKQLEAETSVVVDKSGSAVLLSRGGGSNNDEGNNNNNVNNASSQKLSPQEERDALKKDSVTKGTIKGSSQIQKLSNKPTTDLSELDGEDDDDQQKEDLTVSYQENTSDQSLKQHGNQILIDDPKLIQEIEKIIKEKKSIIVFVDKDLEPENVKGGNPLS
jgi:hypothetical protein